MVQSVVEIRIGCLPTILRFSSTKEIQTQFAIFIHGNVMAMIKMRLSNIAIRVRPIFWQHANEQCNAAKYNAKELLQFAEHGSKLIRSKDCVRLQIAVNI